MTLLFLLHTFYLGLAIILTFIWSGDPTLSHYNLQLTGALVLLYFAFKVISAAKGSRINGTFPSTMILTVISLLLVFSTGGVSSPLFFILNFLLFGLALLFEPVQAATASFILVGLFVWQNHLQLNTSSLVNLISLVFMTPLAIAFSRNYLKNLESLGRIKVLRQAIREEEADSLLWISTKAKPSLATVLNSVTDLVMYFNSKGPNLLPKSSIDKLKAIQDDLISLYTSTGVFEETIKESSDKTED